MIWNPRASSLANRCASWPLKNSFAARARPSGRYCAAATVALRGIGLILAFIADPDLWAGKATTGEERLQTKLIAFLHRRLDFLAGEAVDQCLMFGLVGHI